MFVIMFESKIVLILPVFFLLLAVLYMLGRKSVHHEIIIHASKEKIWSTLMDTDNYDQWNPVMKLLEGKLSEGNKVKYRFTQDRDQVSDISARVVRIIPNETLNQAGGIPVLLTFDHKYILEDADKGSKLTIHEDYRGIGINFWNPQPVEAAYVRLSQALKNQVESK